MNNFGAYNVVFLLHLLPSLYSITHEAAPTLLHQTKCCFTPFFPWMTGLELMCYCSLTCLHGAVCHCLWKASHEKRYNDSLYYYVLFVLSNDCYMAITSLTWCTVHGYCKLSAANYWINVDKAPEENRHLHYFFQTSTFFESCPIPIHVYTSLRVF